MRKSKREDRRKTNNERETNRKNEKRFTETGQSQKFFLFIFIFFCSFCFLGFTPLHIGLFVQCQDILWTLFKVGAEPSVE